jgi:hypothetical protein
MPAFGCGNIVSRNGQAVRGQKTGEPQVEGGPPGAPLRNKIDKIEHKKPAKDAK